MRTLPLLTAIGIVVAYGYAPCTGGMLSLIPKAAAWAGSFEARVQEPTPLMSIAQTLCEADNVRSPSETDHELATEGGGCSGGSCLEAGSPLVLRDRGPAVTYDESAPAPPAAYDTAISQLITRAIIPAAFAAPLFPDAALRARIIVKRE